MNARALLACLVMFCSSAHAVLVDVAGQNYSDDAATGLRWLDPAATGGLSFGEASLIDGWRHATKTELTTLFSGQPVPELMSIFGGPNAGPSQEAARAAGIQSYIALAAIYAPGENGLAWLGATPFGGSGFGFVNTPNAVFHRPIGNYLVSPVPEPSTYAMMGLGLVALVVFARRRRATRGSI